jgi:hypothetical protein
MKNERDLLDYVSLGAELMQTARLGDIRDDVNALAQIEAHKLEAQNREHVARIQEEKIRDFVFNGKKLIDDLEREQASSNPAGTLVLLYGLKDYHEQFRINTMGVRSFEDKEKVNDYMRALKDLTAECEKSIDAITRDKIAKCLKYRAEEEDLKGLISYEEQSSKLRDLQSELEQMEPPGQIFNLPIPLSLLLLSLGLAPLRSLAWQTHRQIDGGTRMEFVCLPSSVHLWCWSSDYGVWCPKAKMMPSFSRRSFRPRRIL